MEKPSISFFAMNFILLFAVIGFILIVFDLTGLTFVFELGILLIFLFFLAFAMYAIYQNKSSGWGTLAGVLILLLIDAFAVFLLTNTLGIAHIITVLFSVIGLIVAFANIATTGMEHGKYLEDKAKYYSTYIDKIEPKKEIEPEIKVEKTFTPGKYIASKNANKFHSPKCDWASRISKTNQIWFNSKEEAQAKGFEADKCI